MTRSVKLGYKSLMIDTIHTVDNEGQQEQE